MVAKTGTPFLLQCDDCSTNMRNLGMELRKLDQQPVETTVYSLDEAAPAPAQRRTDERHLSLLRVGTLLIDGRRELCLIRNISAGGMMIRPYSEIAEGSRVSIELKQDEPVEGTARWTRDECVGVEFDQPIDVIGLISSAGQEARPRKPRIQVSCLAWVREDGTIHRTKALNVSQGGVKVVTSADISVGSDVVVSLPGLPPCPALIRWKNGEAYGITFNRALSLPQLVEWQKQQQSVNKRPKAAAAG